MNINEIQTKLYQLKKARFNRAINYHINFSSYSFTNKLNTKLLNSNIPVILIKWKMKVEIGGFFMRASNRCTGRIISKGKQQSQEESLV